MKKRPNRFLNRLIKKIVLMQKHNFSEDNRLIFRTRNKDVMFVGQPDPFLRYHCDLLPSPVCNIY